MTYLKNHPVIRPNLSRPRQLFTPLQSLNVVQAPEKIVRINAILFPGVQPVQPFVPDRLVTVTHNSQQLGLCFGQLNQLARTFSVFNTVSASWIASTSGSWIVFTQARFLDIPVFVFEIQIAIVVLEFDVWNLWLSFVEKPCSVVNVGWEPF